MPPGSSPPSLPPPSRSSPLSLLLPSSPLPLFSQPAVPTAVSHFLHNFPDLFNPSKRLPTALHNVQHHTKTSGPPLVSRFCCLKGVKISGREGRVRSDGTRWHCAPLYHYYQSLGFSSSHGCQEGQNVAAMQRFHTAESGNRA